MNRKNVLFVSVFCFVMSMFLVAGLAYAQDPTPPPDPGGDMGGFLAFLISAFQGGQYFAVGGMVIMLAVYFVGRFAKIDAIWMPVLNAATGMLASLVVEFLKPEMVWYNALYLGLLGSGPAALFWSALGKRILPQKKPVTADSPTG